MSNDLLHSFAAHVCSLSLSHSLSLSLSLSVFIAISIGPGACTIKILQIRNVWTL